MKYYLFFVTCLFSSTMVSGQYRFHSQNFVGILEGKAGSSFQLLTINGVRRGTWFAGMGTGLDYYYFRSVPLFVSLNKALCDCDRSLFFNIDGGVNWVWDNSTGNYVNGFRNGEFETAPYWGAGVGYKIGLKNKKDAILLNAGFSAKHVREEVKSIAWCLQPPCPESTERIRYNLNRLSLRVGWQF